MRASPRLLLTLTCGALLSVVALATPLVATAAPYHDSAFGVATPATENVLTLVDMGSGEALNGECDFENDTADQVANTNDEQPVEFDTNAEPLGQVIRDPEINGEIAANDTGPPPCRPRACFPPGPLCPCRSDDGQASGEFETSATATQEQVASLDIGFFIRLMDLAAYWSVLDSSASCYPHCTIPPSGLAPVQPDPPDEEAPQSPPPPKGGGPV